MKRSLSTGLLSTIALAWLLLLAVSCGFNWHQIDSAVINFASGEARAFFDRDLVYRRWAAKHGGVYVPVTPETPPNPYLEDIPQRDIETREGRKLTLMNPAYMTRQVYELAAEQSGARAHITSLKPLRPENKPDAWEEKALRTFEQGEREVRGEAIIDGQPYLRFMRALAVEESCLKCHEKQGYIVGQVRGGISVSVSMVPFLAVATQQKNMLLLWHVVLGALGLVALWLGTRRLRRTEQELQQSEAMFQTLAESAYDWEYWLTPQGTLRFCSPSVERLTGYSADDMVRNPALLDEIIVAEDRLLWQQRLKALEGRAGAGGSADFTEIDVRIVTRQGSVRWVACICRLLFDHEGTAQGRRVTVRDISTRKQAEQALLESESRFNVFMDTLPAAVFIKDAEGHVRYCNRFMTHLIGNRSWLGKSTEALFSPEVAERLREEDRHALETGYAVTEEEIPGADGQLRWYETHKFRISRPGQPPMLGGVALDITARKEAEARAESLVMNQHGQMEGEVEQRTQDLSRARDAAQTANRAKSVFLANMSHELRTPLNAILGLAQIMDRDARVPVEQRKNLATIQRSGQHLLELINDVLEISRIESGHLTSSAAPFDLGELLDSATESMALRAAEKGLRLRVERAGDLPVHVAGDLAKLRQILLNLLSNAVKYTKTGEVLLRARQLRREGLVCELEFSVQDSGVGIDSSELERIFAPFYQTDAGIRMGEGTGLGLAISRQYAKLLGGELSATSSPAGSTFRLVVPVTLAAMAPAAKAQGRVLRLSADQPRYRVLVAEDEYVNQEVLKMLLEEVGFDVRVADDGRAAVAIARDWLPHFVWMDIRMPVMDGLAATRAIRALPACAMVPVVALTADVFEGERKAMFAAGCNDVMIKPLMEDRLFALMEQHLGVRFERELLPDAVATDAAAADFTALPEAVRQRLRQAAIGLDSDTVRAIADELATTHPALSQQIIALAYDYRLDRIAALCDAK